MKRKGLAILLYAALLLALAACGKTAPESDAGTGYRDGFFLTTEYERLYYQPFSGETQLLTDRYTASHARGADALYAVYYGGGGVERIDLASGARTTVLASAEAEVDRLTACDGGFIAETYDMENGSTFLLCEDGKEPETLPIPPYAAELCAVGRRLFWSEWDEGKNTVTAYDLDARAELWSREFDESITLCAFGDGVYATRDAGGKFWQLDPESGEITELDLPLEETDYDLRNVWNGVYLVKGNWDDDYNTYLVSKDARERLTLDGSPLDGYVADCTGRYVLLCEYCFEWGGAEDESERSWEEYSMLDMESGELTPLTVRGQYAALFENGDFPLMDSSTARKPVTEAMHSLLCLNPGYSGSRPICSTTHGAWLNIADRKADIALLAAPTEEEQAYLKEQGVEVEMKLYGGDGLVFIGSGECGVSDLSLDEVRAIYRGEITNWSQLGGVDHAIDVLYRDDQSGSQRLFEKLLWKDEPVPDFEKLGFEQLGDMTTIVWECEENPYAIGYSIMTYLDDVFASDDLLAFTLGGVAATPENVAAKTYPLSTQGYVVIRADEPEDSPARRLYDWIGCAVCDELLTNNGVTPLHG